jgi:MoaA/NifB/PqqE/SkfB family radical SAM enzyme
MKDFIQFRFVPTMRCNLKCSYCFLPHSTGKEPTMFDEVTATEWIESMRYFSDKVVEFYMWGGEPFILDDTYKVVKSFADYDFVKWARIDSNLTFTKKIIKECPSEKIKILCSWHTEIFNFEQLWERAMLLNSHNMVGMINFVASDTNMHFLKNNNLHLETIIKKFADYDIFFNIAADFSRGNDPDYKSFITKFMTNEDWDHIHGQYQSKGIECDAGSTFMDVGHNGDITSCGVIKNIFIRSIDKKAKILGNFIKGRIKRYKTRCPRSSCLSIISYCHRLDNDFNPERHLDDYIQRNMEHRRLTLNL